MSWLGVHVVLSQDGEDEKPDDDQNRHDGIDDLHGGVVLGLLGHVLGLAAVLEDGPEDQEQDEAADHEAGDEEELPQVELGAPLRGGSGVLAEARELAPREDERAAEHGDRRQDPGAPSRDGNSRC